MRHGDALGNDAEGAGAVSRGGRPSDPNRAAARTDLVTRLRVALAEAVAERDQLRAFVTAIFDASDWPRGGELDALTMQELATKHGILTPQTRTEPCGEVCQCAEYTSHEEMAGGVECFRKAPWLTTARAPS